MFVRAEHHGVGLEHLGLGLVVRFVVRRQNGIAEINGNGNRPHVGQETRKGDQVVRARGQHGQGVQIEPNHAVQNGTADLRDAHFVLFFRMVCGAMDGLDQKSAGAAGGIEKAHAGGAVIPGLVHKITGQPIGSVIFPQAVAEHLWNEKFVEFLEQIAGPFRLQNGRGRLEIGQATDDAPDRRRERAVPGVQIPGKEIGFEEVGDAALGKTRPAFHRGQLLGHLAVAQSDKLRDERRHLGIALQGQQLDGDEFHQESIERVDGEQQGFQADAGGQVVEMCGFLDGFLGLLQIFAVHDAENAIPLVVEGRHPGQQAAPLAAHGGGIEFGDQQAGDFMVRTEYLRQICCRQRPPGRRADVDQQAGHAGGIQRIRPLGAESALRLELREQLLLVRPHRHGGGEEARGLAVAHEQDVPVVDGHANGLFKKSLRLGSVSLGFFLQIAFDLALCPLDSGPVGQLAGAFVFDDQIAVYGIHSLGRHRRLFLVGGDVDVDPDLLECALQQGFDPHFDVFFRLGGSGLGENIARQLFRIDLPGGFFSHCRHQTF